MNVNVGKNLKELRDKFGYSQEQVASFLDVTLQAVSKWETGDSLPSIENLLKLSRLFGVTVDSLITSVDGYLKLEKFSGLVDFKLRYIYIKNKKGEDVSEDINKVVKLVWHFDKKEEFFGDAAKSLAKATIYAMLEDKNINESNCNLDSFKEILQFANLDNKSQNENIKNYFLTKSKRCRELATTYVNNAFTTAANILSFVISSVNSLDD